MCGFSPKILTRFLFWSTSFYKRCPFVQKFLQEASSWMRKEDVSGLWESYDYGSKTLFDPLFKFLKIEFFWNVGSLSCPETWTKLCVLLLLWHQSTLKACSEMGLRHISMHLRKGRKAGARFMRKELELETLTSIKSDWNATGEYARIVA